MSTTPDGAHRRGSDTTADADDIAVDEHPHHRAPEAVPGPDHGQITARQKERFGGIKWGSAFFGWLTAVGTAVLLTGLVAAAGAAFGQAWAANPDQAADRAARAAQDTGTAQAAGITGAIVAAVVLLLAYYCGGYVAGRMARFTGAKQGVAVWLWTIVLGIVAAIVVAASGLTLGVPDGLPTLPVDEGALTLGGIVAVVIALAVGLVGAILGGLAGMRFHRKVDRAALDPA